GGHLVYQRLRSVSRHLNVDVDAYIGSRALPTLFNYTANMVEARGSVTYNGHGMDEFVAQRTSAYISQHDLHIGEMTVRETLDFSARCQGVGSRYEVLSELSRRERDQGIKPDPDIDVFMKAAAMEGQKTTTLGSRMWDMNPVLILIRIGNDCDQILGLDICGDTLVGDNMQRGISGGQKKRVTTGEMIVGPAKAFFMDEISTGLDSSTTYQIVQCLRQIVHVYNSTMVVSLLQPAPETFDLFDDVILLSEGRLLYQGPRESIVQFFESMGFACPERKGVADFLQEVTSRKDQEQYWVRESQPYCYVPVKEFADAFQSFNVGVQLNSELSIPYDKSTSHPAALTTKEYGLSKTELMKACIDREVLLMKRSSFIYIFKLFQITTIALITLTVFFRTEMHDRDVADGSVYFGALFFTLMNIMFNGFVELSITMTRLPVFYKQRDSKLYPAWAYSLPTWVMRVPLSLMESSIWVILTYYTIGFDSNPNRFFRQFLLLFILHQMSLSLFRFIAAVGRSQIVANTFGTFALLIILVLGGFIVSREDIKPWWIWGYWSSPLMYAQNAIAVNEFLASRWQKPGNNIGTKLLESRGLFTQSYWYWMTLGILAGYAIIFNILYTLALAYLDPLGRPQALIPDDDLDKKHENKIGEIRHTPQEMQTISSNGGGKKGMVLPFQPLAMAFENVSYYVDMPAEMKQQGVTEDRLQLLREVSGSFRPGVLTCLMGVSGAGKTTLMDVLAGRKTGGYIEGSVTISGYPKQQETFARISGYCEQNDIHSPYVTVYESLVYSAWLRLPKEVDPQARKKQQDVFNAMGSMFAAIVFIGVNNATSIQPVVEVERTVFYREKAAGMYSPLPYALAQILIELPYVFVQSVMYGLIVYAMIDFNWVTAKFFWFFFFMFFTFLYHTYYGMMTVALTPNATMAAIVSSGFYGIWMLFSGFLIPRLKIPIWWRWYYWACPYAWTLYGLITSQYGDVTDLMSEAGTEEQVPVGKFLESYFGFKHDFLGEVAIVIVGFVLLFAFVFAWSIRSINFQSR
ncbi:hypothetical protein KI387_042541, partial [Taxus chinensis]